MSGIPLFFPDSIKDKLMRGHKADGKYFKVHLDGYDQGDLLAVCDAELADGAREHALVAAAVFLAELVDLVALVVFEELLPAGLGLLVGLGPGMLLAPIQKIRVRR